MREDDPTTYARWLRQTADLIVADIEEQMYGHRNIIAYKPRVYAVDRVVERLERQMERF